MRTSLYTLALLFAIAMQPARAGDADAKRTNSTNQADSEQLDALEASEAVVIDREVVEKVSNSATTLDEVLDRGRENTRSAAAEDYGVNRAKSRMEDVNARSAADRKRADGAVEQGGQEAQRIMKQTSRDAVEAQQRESFANEFADEVEEGVEYGFHEAGHVVGEGIADEVLGTDGKRLHRYPRRLHHDRVHDSD